jgi:hypothetical protein
MNTVYIIAAKLLVRFQFWPQAVFVLSLVRPWKKWNQDIRGRFAYTCMMGKDSSLVKGIFSKILRKTVDGSSEANLWLAKVSWSLGRIKLAISIYKRTERLESTQEQKSAAICLQDFAQSITDQTIYSIISDLIDQLSLPNAGTFPLILTPVSNRYFDLFEYWMQQLRQHAQGHLIVMSLDSDSGVRLQREYGVDSLDLSSYFAFSDEKVINRYCRNNLWILRIMILRELIMRGHTVISLDLDALVIGNLNSLLDSLPKSDIVAQMDYSIPMDVARKYGFIVCCGFMTIRSNPATIQFLDQYHNQTILELDDQLALNHLLAEVDIKAIVSNSSYTQFNAGGLSWICPDKSIVSRDISYGTVIRHFQQVGLSVEQLKSTISQTRSSP